MAAPRDICREHGNTFKAHVIMYEPGCGAEKVKNPREKSAGKHPPPTLFGSSSNWPCRFMNRERGKLFEPRLRFSDRYTARLSLTYP